jgi:hypothetical protein
MIPFLLQEGAMGLDLGEPMAPYPNRVLRAPFSAGMTDYGPNPKTLTATNGAAISATSPKYGPGSLALDGVNDYVTAPTSTDFDLGTVWTVATWVKFNNFTTDCGVIHKGKYNLSTFVWNDFAFSLRMLSSGVLRYYFNVTIGSATEYSVDVAASGNLTAGQWHYIEMVRDGGTGYAFVDGVLKGTIGIAGSGVASTEPFYIGSWATTAGATRNLPGYVYDTTILKGVALHLRNYTPPQWPLPVE